MSTAAIFNPPHWPPISSLLEASRESLIDMVVYVVIVVFVIILDTISNTKAVPPHIRERLLYWMDCPSSRLPVFPSSRLQRGKRLIVESASPSSRLEMGGQKGTRHTKSYCALPGIYSNNSRKRPFITPLLVEQRLVKIGTSKIRRLDAWEALGFRS